MIKDNLVFAIENDSLRIFIIGEITHTTARKMREKIDEKIFELSLKKVILDFSQLEFMDSAGIGLIIGRNRVIKEVNAELVIENPSANIFNILKCSGIDKIVKIEN